MLPSFRGLSLFLIAFFAMGFRAVFLHGETADGDQPEPSSGIRFVMHRVGTFRSEACGVGDFNNDGKLDVVAGPYLYLAPDWKTQKIRELDGNVDEEGKGYYDDFMNVPCDVDGDGLLDVVSCSWFKKCSLWHRNTGRPGELWPESIVERNGNFEAGDAWDLLGSGKADVILPAVQRTVWYESAADANGQRRLVPHVVSEKAFDWGVGVGDLSGDGRPHILRPNAWFEAPADVRNDPWIEHPMELGDRKVNLKDMVQMWTCDVNGDGRNDVLCSSAHDYGIYWYEQVPQGTQTVWKQHVIDDTWSQVHSLRMADLDGDGAPELIAGKRFMAHNGGDPGAFEPLGVYYYRLERNPTPRWVKHIVTYDEGIGSGMNIETADINADGRLDIVTTGKYGGPVWFENQGAPTP